MSHYSFNIIHTVKVNNNQIFLDENLLLQGGETELIIDAYKYLNINYPKFYKMDLMSKWGIVCAELLLRHHNPGHTADYKKAIVLQNSSSSLLTDRNFQHSIETIASPALFVYTLPNIVMGEIAIRHKFKGENTFFITPQYDEKQLAEYTGMLFENNLAEIALCGYLEVTENTQDIVMWLCTS